MSGEPDSNRLALLGIPGVPALKGRKTYADIARETGASEEQVKQILLNNQRGKRNTEEEMGAFKKIVGKYGMAHNPELNSEATANMWLRDKIAASQKIKDPIQREKAVAKWQQYAVDFQDLDDDPSTPENLLVLNRTNPNDIYAIDGYRLAPKAPHLVQRGVYDAFPTHAERTKYSELLPEYKRWLRKYLLPEQRELHPFTREEAAKFEHQQTIAEMVRKVVDDKAKALGFVISIPDPLVEGERITQITPPHRMAVIGKLFGDIYGQIVLPMLMHQLYPQITGYNWSEDPNKYLNSKAVKNAMKEYVLKRGGIQNLTGFGISDQAFAQWLIQGARSIGVQVMFGEDGKVSKIVDQDAVDANRIRAEKKDRGPRASFATRYDALYKGDLATELGKKAREFSVRRTGRNAGDYTRGGTLGVRAPVSFQNGPTRWAPASSSSSSSASSSSNAWPFSTQQ